MDKYTAKENINTKDKQSVNSEANGHTSSNVVWQWLSYALWEWLLLSLAVLISAMLTYYINHSANTSVSGAVVVYSMVAMICILPFAFIANKIYSKIEPPHKHGFSAVIMVLNALLVFLVTLGGLITALVTVVFQLVNNTSSVTTGILITSSLVTAVLGGLLFIKIMSLSRLTQYTKLFPLIIFVIMAVAVFISLIGPFRSEFATRQDRLIENNLPTIDSDIQNYSGNGTLPSSLHISNLTQNYNPGEKALINKNLVSYKIIGKNYDAQNFDTVLTYELCVTYDYKKGNGTNNTNNGSTYGTIDTSNHSTGYHCYNQTATSYVGTE